MCSQTSSAPAGTWLAAGSLELAGGIDQRVAVDTIDRFLPADEAQAGARRDTLDFCVAHDDALHRSCSEGHLTASAWVVDHSGKRGMLLLHAKVGRWLQPGGHADGDSNLAAVALKEVSEETGLAGLEVWSEPVDIDVHLFVNRKGTELDHLHHDVRFLVRAGVGAVAETNHESEGHRWVRADELHDPSLELDESTLRLARYGFALAGVLGVKSAT
jgi:8-oxo-dGTP pyrophosphatase MutT (NUDIX family)